MTYQTFDDQLGASASSRKLERLCLPDLSGKSFLDLGCNEGFFCGYALQQGATKVVGIERNRDFYERAMRRFPDGVFLNQSWDEPIPDTYDVVLFSSALHYSDEKQVLLGRILDVLKPNGILVLECGVAPGDQLVEVETWRKVGVVSHPTHPLLMNYLHDYVVKEVGPSVFQNGDPVPRYVFHCKRSFLKAVIFLSAESGLGKSTIAENWPKKRVVALDGLMAEFQREVLLESGCRLEVPRLLARIHHEELWDRFFSWVFGKIDQMQLDRSNALMIVGYALAHPEVDRKVRQYFEGVSIWELKPYVADGAPTTKVADAFNLFELAPDFIDVPLAKYFQMRPDGKSFLLHPPIAGAVSKIGWKLASLEGRSRFQCELSLPHKGSRVECALEIAANGRSLTFATVVQPGEYRKWEIDIGSQNGPIAISLQTALHGEGASCDRSWLIVHSPRLCI